MQSSRPSNAVLGPITTITVPSASPALLPLTASSIWYVVQLPDQSRIRVVVSHTTTVGEVIEALALRHSDLPLLEECQLLRNKFPLSKRSRLCALAPRNTVGGVNNSIAFAAANMPQNTTDGAQQRSSSRNGKSWWNPFSSASSSSNDSSISASVSQHTTPSPVTLAQQRNKSLSPAGRALLSNTIDAGKLQVDLEFVMAYEDPHLVTEDIVAAAVEHAATTMSGSPRRDPRRGEGNLYTTGSRRSSSATRFETLTNGGSASIGISQRYTMPARPQQFSTSALSAAKTRNVSYQPKNTVLLNAPSGNNSFYSSDSVLSRANNEGGAAVGVQYRAGSGFRAVTQRQQSVASNTVEAPSFVITVKLLATGVKELRRLKVHSSDPVAMLRDELFPSLESSAPFRLYCDQYVILNESASFEELLITDQNVLEFRVDVEEDEVEDSEEQRLRRRKLQSPTKAKTEGSASRTSFRSKQPEVYQGSIYGPAYTVSGHHAAASAARATSEASRRRSSRSRASSIGSHYSNNDIKDNDVNPVVTPRGAPSPTRLQRGESTLRRHIAEPSPKLGAIGAVVRGDPVDREEAHEWDLVDRTFARQDREQQLLAFARAEEEALYERRRLLQPGRPYEDLPNDSAMIRREGYYEAAHQLLEDPSPIPRDANYIDHRDNFERRYNIPSRRFPVADSHASDYEVLGNATMVNYRREDDEALLSAQSQRHMRDLEQRTDDLRSPDPRGTGRFIESPRARGKTQTKAATPLPKIDFGPQSPTRNPNRLIDYTAPPRADSSLLRGTGAYREASRYDDDVYVAPRSAVAAPPYSSDALVSSAALRRSPSTDRAPRMGPYPNYSSANQSLIVNPPSTRARSPPFTRTRNSPRNRASSAHRKRSASPPKSRVYVSTDLQRHDPLRRLPQEGINDYQSTPISASLRYEIHTLRSSGDSGARARPPTTMLSNRYEEESEDMVSEDTRSALSARRLKAARPPPLLRSDVNTQASQTQSSSLPPPPVTYIPVGETLPPPPTGPSTPTPPYSPRERIPILTERTKISRSPPSPKRTAVSTSTVGDAAREPSGERNSVGRLKVYDPTQQVPIVFVDPDQEDYFHHMNVYGTHLVTRLRDFAPKRSPPVSYDVMCDGMTVVRADVDTSPLTFWDVTRGKKGKVFSLRAVISD